jgi:hypothetical protein
MPTNRGIALSPLRWIVTGTVLVLGSIVLLGAAATRAGAVYMTMASTKEEGGVVKLCIGVDSGGQKVAGTQNDLVWDASCASLKADTCAAVPDSKKPLHGNQPPNLTATYRALVFALDNVDPVRDGLLYCCDVAVTAPGDGCCAVRFDRLGASDPSGNALDTLGNPPQLCLATGAAPPGAAVPAAPAASSAGGGQWVWVLLIGVVVVIVAALLLRGRSA